MNFILHLLLDAAVIFGSGVSHAADFGQEFWNGPGYCHVLGLLNFFVGWIIRFPLNLVTLFLLTGLVRIIVTALLLKLIDHLWIVLRLWLLARPCYCRICCYSGYAHRPLRPNARNG